MNLEELKLILETVESVAGTAGIAGVIWLVLHYVAIMVGALAAPVAWVLACIYGIRYIKDAVASVYGTRVKLELEKEQNAGHKFDKHCKMFINEDVYQQFCEQVTRIRGDSQYSYIHESHVNRLRDAINLYELQKKQSTFEATRKEQA